MTKLERMVDAFAEAMKKKLLVKQRAGYSGWDDVSIGVLEQKLADHFSRGAGQEVDVANFAAMLWFRRQEQERIADRAVARWRGRAEDSKERK